MLSMLLLLLGVRMFLRRYNYWYHVGIEIYHRQLETESHAGNSYYFQTISYANSTTHPKFVTISRDA